MELEEFEEYIQLEVETECTINGESNTAVFAQKIVGMMQDAEVLSDSEYMPVFYENVSQKRGRKMRIDGYLFDEADHSFYLFICDMDAETMTKTQSETNFKRLLVLADDVLHTDLYLDVDPSRPESEMMDVLRKERENIVKYKLILLTDASKSSRIQSIENREIDGRPAECQIWDIERIYNLYMSQQEAEDIVIDFTEYIPEGLPCLLADQNDKYNSYLGVLSGQLLADIYDKYGSRLLEGNVRSFLSIRGSVNKKIRATILNEPEMFFAYNNGIAATAKELTFERTGDGIRLVKALDFQIINGGQTTASLASAAFKDKGKADLNKVSVQMKLTEIGEMTNDAANELIHNISRSSNSQNKVSEADFFSTSPFHVQMEAFSRRIQAPAAVGVQYQTKWFYERARGQFVQAQMHMTQAQKKEYTLLFPKKQVITKTDLAKYLNSWNGLPHIVSKGAQANFMSFAVDITAKWEKDTTQFSEIYFKQCVALAILFKYLEQKISAQSWYNSYRANIVTYTMALFHRDVQTKSKQYDFDLMQIWNKQEVPSSLEPYLIQTAKAVSDFITDPKRPVMNVTQWCKQELCWKRMQEQIHISLEDQVLIPLLKERTAITKDKKDARKVQEFDSDEKALEAVIKIPAEIWQQIKLDAEKNKLIRTVKEQNALRAAANIPNSMPQSFQAKLLIKFLEHMKENGFSYGS